jgi:CO/xanthine dehydrogenase FAD-binding subunit
LYPRPFEYFRPESVADAVKSLRAPAGEARAIAGGQSLVPMLSLGLAQPDVLVDIGRLELSGSERINGSVALGALTRHRELERSDELAALVPLAAEAAHYIGNPRVRNRGTLGGSLAHADPASELGAVALTYGGHAVITGTEGERRVSFDEFFEGYFATAVRPGELLTKVEFTIPPDGSGHGFYEIANRADDFATAAATALVTVDDQGACKKARIALAGVADRPTRCPEAEDRVTGETLSEELIEEIGRTVSEVVSPEEDAFVSAGYRSRAAGTCAARAVTDAWRRAMGEQA